jgi:hypothetical protein
MNEQLQPDETPRPDKSSKLDENRDQSLAEVRPAPLPDSSAHSVLGTILKTGVALVAAAGALALFAATMMPGNGATRSAKLKVAERQRLIEQAERHAKPAPTKRG